MIHLVIPAFSLAEPHIALMRKQNKRRALSSELQKHLSELGRSRSYREVSGNFNELVGLLNKSADRERAGLQHAMDAMLKTAEVIPLDSDMFHVASDFQGLFDVSVQDSIVLASVVKHLAETKPPESCFLNRNTKDFDDPDLREMLDDLGCRFFGRFDHALQYIAARLRKAGQ